LEARNRNIRDWYGKVQRGEIKLPRFQRFEAWDQHRIASLVQTVIQNLPLGITLILEVGEEEKFVSRYLKTAPESPNRVREHLLDGQQRLTALWRSLHNNYEWTTYFIYIRALDRYDQEPRENLSIYGKGRYIKQSTGDRFPLWCDKPEQCLLRGFIPTHLLRPEDIQSDIDDWVEKATSPLEPNDGKEALKQFYDFQKQVSDQIKDLRAIVANYNLPYTKSAN
jgi:Protein of unknown function DUF262